MGDAQKLEPEMDAKIYRVSSMQEALQLIREDLGADASVLSAREAPVSWWGRLSGRRELEVTASAHVQAPSRLPQAMRTKQPAVALESRDVATQMMHGGSREEELVEPAASSVKEDVADSIARVTPKRVVHDITPQSDDEVVDKPDRITEESDGISPPFLSASTFTDPVPPETHRRPAAPTSIHRTLNRPQGEPDRASGSPLSRMLDRLLELEIPEPTARALLHLLQREPDFPRLTPRQWMVRLARKIETKIEISGPIRLTPGEARVVALIGPTGVGKTTTIAKLAANFHLTRNCRVGLITMDTFRIAAADQLRAYAQIIDLPMSVVGSPQEMSRAIRKLAHLDLILVDTAGHGHQEELRLAELRAIIHQSRADEIHLVLSSVASAGSLVNSADRFREIGAASLLLTKFDEASGLGNLLPLLLDRDLPISYITTGQNVPHDIEPADTRQLVRRILGARRQAAS